MVFLSSHINLNIPYDKMPMDSHSAFRQRFIDAANQNTSIQEFRADARFAPIWKEENIRRSPPLRVEFEHAIVLGTIVEAISMRRREKGVGQVLTDRSATPRRRPTSHTHCLQAES